MRALATERREDDDYYPIRIDYDSSLKTSSTSNKKYMNGRFGGSVHSIHSVHTQPPPPEACVTNNTTTANCTLRRNNNNNASCHNQYYNSVPIRKSQMRSSESLGITK